MQSLDLPLHTCTSSGLEQPPLDARMDGDDFVAFLEVPAPAEAPTIAVGGDRLVVEGFQAVSTGVLRINIPLRTTPQPT